MRRKLDDELIDTMTAALGELARLIGSGVQPDRETLKNILLKTGVGKNESALDEFTHWCQQLILAQSSKETKEAIISILQERGVREAPAMLAVERAGGLPISSDKHNIDFGLLKPGEGANTTITVNGSFSSALSTHNKLNITHTNIGSNRTLVKVILPLGSGGETLRDTLLILGDQAELRIPVIARWEKESKIIGRPNEIVKIPSDIASAIRLNPQDAQAYNKRGWAHYCNKDYDKAIADFTRAINLDPKDRDKYIRRGNAYTAKKEHEKAIADYTSAIKMDPKDAHAYINRAFANNSKGQYDNAIADCTKAIELDSIFALAYYHRGLAYKQQGELSKADADLNKAKELGLKG